MTRLLVCVLAVGMMGANWAPCVKGDGRCRVVESESDLCNPADIETALWLALEHLEPKRQGNSMSEADRLRGRDEHIQFIRKVQEACAGS